MSHNSSAYLLVAAALVLAAVLSFYYLSHSAKATTNASEYLNSLPKGTISIASQHYTVLLALNETAWQQGLMNASEDSLAQTGAMGMVFAFPNNSVQCFWMENTPMRLQQAWIANGTIAYVYNATPYSTASVCHYGSSVLEVPSAYGIALRAGEPAALEG